MADPLQFELVSPEQLLVSEEVEQVVVPGSEGFFTVLARHAPFMTTLRPGIVEVRMQSGAEQRFYVRGGFADVTPAGLTILADAAIRLEEFDAAALAEEIRIAEEGLAELGADSVRRVGAEKRLQEMRDVERWIIPA
jgi:F-type H+-transporting ATPase subunit epsilon